MTNFIEQALERKKEQNPQMEYMWRVSLPDFSDSIEQRSYGDKVKDQALSKIDGFWGTIGNAVIAPWTAASVIIGAAIEDDITPNDEINHRVTAFDLPFPSVEVRKVNSKGTGWKAAAGRSLSTISCKMMEYEDGGTLKYLTEWMKLVNPDGGYHNPPIFYKKKITFIRMSVAGFDLHVSTCLGCFPIEIGNASHAYDANGIQQYSATFSVDEIEHEIIPYDVVLTRIQKEQLDIANSPDNPFSSVFDIKRHLWDITTGV